MDLTSLRDIFQLWSENLLQDEQQLSVIGRVAVLVGATLIASGLTWFASRLGWTGLKLGSRGLRRLCRGRPGDPQIEMLYRGIEHSLWDKAQRCMAEAPSSCMAFSNGYVDLDEQKLQMGEEGAPYEDITGRFTRGQKRRLLSLAKRLYEESRAKHESQRTHELVEMLFPVPEADLCVDQPPVTVEPSPDKIAHQARLQAMLRQALATAEVEGKTRRQAAIRHALEKAEQQEGKPGMPPITEGPFPGEAEGKTRLHAMLSHALDGAGQQEGEPTSAWPFKS